MPMKDGIYTFRGFFIPEYMMGPLQRYIKERSPVGDFLTAVICNDLKGAVDRADDTNLANIPAYVGYLYNEAPSGCWGSQEAMARWLEGEQALPDDSQSDPSPTVPCNENDPKGGIHG